MVKIKKLETIKEHYKGAAGTAAARFKDAIPTIEWQKPALEGQDLYVEQMKRDEVLARRKIQIAKVSDAEFRAALEMKGAKVIRERMEAAADKQASGFSPYHKVLSDLILPKRSADPIENVDKRLKAVVQALVAKKKELMAS